MDIKLEKGQIGVILGPSGSGKSISINMLIPMILNPLYVLISFVLIFVVYKITKWFCGRKLTKISMSEALKSGLE
ncbi:hypothetical protein [Ktedonobacter sp. SOSP1-52]|uniref:hypothetical protein n=1 Tax=Ktedonobacter sp. SOSP1-52 TaxID=2778366 RepID=UPI001915BAD9